jgi:GTP-binding protein
LAGDRVIVSEIPGTTRDSVDVRFEKDAKVLTVIDTAGVRKKRHMMTNDIEFYSFHRAERSIRRADVVMMLMDGTEAISEPDKKLAAYIGEQYKPVILVVNKWDLAMGYAREQLLATADNKFVRDEDLMEKFEEYVRTELPHLNYAPLAFITAKDSKNVQAVLDLSQHLYKQAHDRPSTGHLNRAIQQVLAERTPSSPSGRRPKIYYATQIDVAPPTIVLFVNNPDFIDEAYRRFVVNRFREILPYGEVPIKLVIRGKGPRPEGGVEITDEDHKGPPHRPGRGAPAVAAARTPSQPPARGDKPTHGGKATRAGKPAHGDKSPRADKPERRGKSPRAGKPERRGKSAPSRKPSRSGPSGRAGKTGRRHR